MTADILIVGGGSAGCVLAARLSEDPLLRVILLEAGDDTPPFGTPADITDVFPRSYANPAYFWPGLEARPRPGEALVPFSQARILGGGSSVMGLWALRGLAADYDGWGIPGWGFSDLLACYNRLARDLDVPAGAAEGPVPILRRARSTWPGFTKAIAVAAGRRGLPFLEDLNGTDEDGVAAMPFSTDGTARASAASCYLTGEVRARPNLQLCTETEVTSLLFDGRRATGVRIRRRDASEAQITGTQIILACGAIHSPVLLLRSGIGPAASLAAAGIAPLADAPGVGRNLQNHAFVHLGAVIRAGARQDPTLRSYALGCIRASSGLPGAPPSDLFLSLMSRTGPRAADIRLGMIGVSLYSPYARGSVSLAAPGSAPLIDLDLLTDARDRARLVSGARLARDLLADPRVAETINESFVLPAKLPIRLLNQPGLKSRAVSLAIAALLESGSLPRRAALAWGLGRERLLAARTDEAGFERLVVASATSMFHPAGTCALGEVVDASTQVRGVQNLFVVDASIMPKVPRANTNIPTLMVAERAAVLLAARFRHGRGAAPNPARNLAPGPIY